MVGTDDIARNGIGGDELVHLTALNALVNASGLLSGLDMNDGYDEQASIE